MDLSILPYAILTCFGEHRPGIKKDYSRKKGNDPDPKKSDRSW